MPKPIFYAGVVVCALLALTSLTQAARGSSLDALLPLASEAPQRSLMLTLLVLTMIIPVAAIFLRMASLLAARNLFGALFAAFSIACAGLCFTLLVALELRLLNQLEKLALVPIEALRELVASVFYAFGWLLSMSMLALRPYFRFQASRALTALMYLPLPVFFWYMAADLGLGRAAGLSVSAPSLVYWSLLATLFLSITVHCLRHRRQFIEPTNLRNLLDSRSATPGGGAGRRRLPYGGVAFDS